MTGASRSFAAATSPRPIDTASALNIAHLVDSLDCGGAEQVVANLALWQRRHGHAVGIVCLRDLGPNPVDVGALRAAGVTITTLGKPDGFHLPTLRRLTRWLRSASVDVVHTHNHLVHHYGVAAGRAAGSRAIVNTLHGSASLRMPLAPRALFWSACMASDKVVSVCASVDAALRRRIPLANTKYHVIDNGIDLSRFLAIPPRTSGEHVVFGTIGRFDPIKDHDNLLRAFALVQRRHAESRLRLLGEGGLRDHLQDLARSLGIEHAVSFEGFSLDTPKFLAELDVYVIPSRSEGLPLTLLEAMAAGLPIVATAVGEIPEIVDKAGNGWLCPPANHERLAETMELALRAPDRASRGACGRQAVEHHYSIERMARDYEDLYATLARRGPSA